VTQRHAILVEAELDLLSHTDVQAPGGSVTVALCGHWDHEGTCRWPHNTSVDTSVSPPRLRTVVVVDGETQDEVVRRIEGAFSPTIAGRLAPSLSGVSNREIVR
jgi:hypothetical protein